MAKSKTAKSDKDLQNETAKAVAVAQDIARRYTADRPESFVDAFLAARRGEWGHEDSD